ncbi:hypothetical protein V8C86DRAFT_3152686, partial [Haematococcus lacustris]
MKLLVADNGCVRQATGQLLHTYLRLPVLFEAFGAGAASVPHHLAVEQLGGSWLPNASAAPALSTTPEGGFMAAGHGGAEGGQEVAERKAGEEAVKSCESKLVQELRTLMEPQGAGSGADQRSAQQPMSPTASFNPGSEARASVLHVAASLVGRLRNSFVSLVPLLMVVGSLGRDELEMRATASQALGDIAARAGTTPAALLLHSPSTKGVLDYVGRHIADSPRLLPELSRLLQMDDSALARAIVPHVIGWLCLHRKADALATLAELLGTTSQALFANYADHAIAYAFWVGNQRIGDFVEFVDALMAPQDDDFISVTKVTAKDVAQQVIWQAGLPLHWDGTYDPPSDIVACSHDYLDELAKIMGLTGTSPTHPAPPSPPDHANAPTRAAELLSGHPVANLLKDFGDSFKGAPPPPPPPPLPPPSPPTPRQAGPPSIQAQALPAQQLPTPTPAHPHPAAAGGDDWVSHIMAVLTAALRDVRSPVVKLQALTAWRGVCGGAGRGGSDADGAHLWCRWVAVVLLPALEEGGAGQGLAVAILEDLVLTHRSHTAAALARMPPLPSLPGLERLHGVLGREQGSGQQGKHLKLLISALEHESLAVRHSGLGELRGFLTKQRKWVGNLLSAALGMDGCMERSRRRGGWGGGGGLAGGLAAEPSSVRPALLSCWSPHGLLAALLRDTPCALTWPPLPLVDGGIDGQGVARMAVTRHLVRILTTTSDLGTLEFVSYAIQARDRAILQHYSQFPTSGSRPPKTTPRSNAAASATAAAAASASAGTESVMGVAALVREDSDASAQIADDAAAPRGRGRSDAGTGALQQMSSAGSGLTAGLGPAGTGPVLFGSRQFSCRRWLELWLRGMIKASTGPCQPAFNALATCLKFDLPLMLYALPQVVFKRGGTGQPCSSGLHQGGDSRIAVSRQPVCWGGSSSRGGRGGAGQGGPMDPGGGAPGASTGSSRVPRQPPAWAAQRSLDVWGGGGGGPGGPGGGPVPELELYLQGLFTLLDVLSRYPPRLGHRHASRPDSATNSGASGAGAGTSPVAKVAAFLDGIPKQQLAQAALRCGAHARALQYYETWVRSVQGGGLNPAACNSNIQYTSSQVSFLLAVYGQLEEPDGIAGLVQLRPGGLTPPLTRSPPPSPPPPHPLTSGAADQVHPPLPSPPHLPLRLLSRPVPTSLLRPTWPAAAAPYSSAFLPYCPTDQLPPSFHPASTQLPPAPALVQILAAEKAGAWGESHGAVRAALTHSSQAAAPPDNSPGLPLAPACGCSWWGGGGGGKRGSRPEPVPAASSPGLLALSGWGLGGWGGEVQGGGAAGGLGMLSGTGLSPLQQGALRGMLHLGHLQALMKQVDGLLARLLPGAPQPAPPPWQQR